MASVVSELIVNARANTEEAQAKIGNLKDGIALLTTAATAVAAAIVGVGVALVDFASQADEQQRQMGRLAFALDQAGLSAEQASARMERMFTTLSRVSGISDEELREATTAFVNLAGAIGLSAGEIESGAALVVDIAAQTGRSAERIARQVADAAAGNAAALTALAPGLRGVAEEIAAFENPAVRGEMALAALQDTFGGAAESTRGLGVNLQVLRNEFGDLQQSIGDQVLASGEFTGALEQLLEALRRVDAEVRNTDSTLSESFRNVGMIFEGIATAVNKVTGPILALYNANVDFAAAAFDVSFSLFGTAAEAVYTPFAALYTLFAEGLGPAINRVGEGWTGVGESINRIGSSLGEFTDSWRMLGYEITGIESFAPRAINALGEEVSSLERNTVHMSNAWNLAGDAIERALAVGQRMLPGVQRQAADLFASVRDFAFEGGQTRTPSRASSAPSGPSAADEAAKVKESLTLEQQARDEAAATQIANEQGKAQALIELQKALEEERLRIEADANAERLRMTEELATKSKETEIAAARAALAERETLGRRQAAIASGVASAAVASLDIIASGEARSGRERRKEIGTTLAAQGRGYILQAIPEFFLNPARGAALAAGGAGLITLGAALGGRVFGSAGAGGGGASAGGAGFGSQGTGLSAPAPAPSAPAPVVVNDFAGAVVVANDPDTFRGVARRLDEVRESGMGGVL